MGRFNTAIDDFMVVRRVEENEVVHLVDAPMIGITLQGVKFSVIGNDEYHYGEGHCLINGIDMPTVSRITSITPEKTFLAVALLLDRALVAQLAKETPGSQNVSVHNKPVAVADADPKVLDAFLRLITLLDHPAEIPIMSPLLKREIHHFGHRSQ